MNNNADILIDIKNITKKYDNGFTALDDVSLQIKKGEIIALLGPNGAGKTTLISTICGIITPTSGNISVGGFDTLKDYRDTRKMIGLVPQELTTDAFETVFDTVSFTRGLFGKPRDKSIIEKILKDLSLWDKKDNKLRELSGGMKRRVLIAKALSHEPDILFLDEPTAGVDVELRKDMWNVMRALSKTGVTIILTTHYIEEAEEMADRIGVISKGRILLVEQTSELMRKLGHKEMLIEISEPLDTLPASLQAFDLTLSDDRKLITYSYNANQEHPGITRLLKALIEADIRTTDISTKQSSLEDIFVNLVRDAA
ncbi:ABC transporter ATP-binding protein [Ahrensia sp. 13_GOM-1096m]|uniref:ABC transporter ATP-binding protein n=1 Tax=Ahrensia sp. 13_GOM-1096m TaxID=1380380 RepID=UPI00047B33F8|nr:ABC transporter ATP-binding protein [Ahrensia sp. 13_GOM-1096m]